MRTFDTYEDAIDAIVNDHPGAIIDRVQVVIDECVYTLTEENGRVTGTDTFRPVDSLD